MDRAYAIFDMDGTLIDSMPYWRDLGKSYLQSKGIPQLPPHIEESIQSMTLSESAELFTKSFSLGLSPEECAREMNQLMERFYREQIPLKGGVRDYIKSLCQQGCRLCVASATEESLMKACLQRLGILEDFQFILSCESLHSHKREPLIYLEAARRFAAAPAEIAVYEDALYALKTAKKAGFYCLAVYDPEGEKDWAELCSLADESIHFD